MRIKLTKQEKQIMKRLQQGVADKPENMSDAMFRWSVTNLSNHLLISVLYFENSIPKWEFTLKGKAYLESNPRLRNPIDWKWIISIILSAIVAIATTLALFVACTKFV